MKFEIDIMRERKLIEVLNDDPAVILMLKPECTTEAMWRTAIQNEPSLFQYIKEPSDDIILFALQEDGANLSHLRSMGIPFTPERIFTAVRSYPGAIFMVPEGLRTKRLKELACKGDQSLMREIDMPKIWIDNNLKRDPTLVRFLPNPTEEQLIEAIKADPNACAYIHYFTPKIKELIKQLYPDIIPLIPRLSEEFSENDDD